MSRIERNRIEWGAAADPDIGARPEGRQAIAPLRRWLRRRTDTYYERTLADRSLAASWREHYLGGLELPPDTEAFEHGCGRGRHIGLLTQLGFRVAGLDRHSDPWWDQFPGACFHVVQEHHRRLPWMESQFDLALSFLVISCLPEDQAENLLLEMYRVLKPGGYLLIFEVNANGFGAASAVKWYGRLHPAEIIRGMAGRSGFREVDFSIEGFASPLFHSTVNVLRKSFSPRGVKMTDYDSWLARLLPEGRRDRWLLRLRKPGA